MLKNLFTFLCDSSSVDGADGKLSAYKLFDEFNVPATQEGGTKEVVVLLIKFDLISGWIIDDPSSRPIKLTVIKKIFNAENEKIAESISPMDLPENQVRFNIRENIQGLPVKGFGDYIFELIIKENDRVAGRVKYPFRVNSVNNE
jgi:hypothetical protein